MEELHYIKPELLVLVPVLYTVGLGIKKSRIPDKYIPFILGIISVSLSGMWVASTSNFVDWRDALYALFTSITQGILIAGASVYVNQLYIQSKKDK